jgi:alpha-beta hydrolase superfamily lysophospholipase
MSSQTDTVVAGDGTKLRTRSWRVAGEPWAVVLLVHGLSEHSGRYEHVGEWLSAAGLEVHAYDHRGFGASEGRRGDVRRWSLLLDDLGARLAELRRPGMPLVLYGHSLGGLICVEYAESSRPQPDALVVSAPAIDSGHPRYLHWLAAVLGRIVPWLSLSGGDDFSVLSRDPAVGEAFRHDPLVVNRLTTRFGLEAFRAQRRARRGLARIQVPTLVMHGGTDWLVPVAASAPLGRVPGVTRRVYPGLRHELHNEPEGHQVVADVVAWLRSCLVDDHRLLDDDRPAHKEQERRAEQQ